jgi:hypothetical protein
MRCIYLLPLLFLAVLSHPTYAAWADGAWPFRREITVAWDPEKATGEDLAVADFYTDGLHETSGENIRVTNEAGNFLPCRVLMLGPGDRMRILFQLTRGGKKYYVYFGHPKPPAPPRGTEDLPITHGLLLEMHHLQGRAAENFAQMEAAWTHSTQLIGREMVPQLYLGFNPFDDTIPIISKFTGTLNCPIDGEYTFAGSASDKGALYLDDKPLLFIPANPGDTRFRAKIDLKRGKHKLVAYELNVAGEQRISIVWSKPDDKRFVLIPPDTFGLFHRGTAGPLESNGKQFLADFKIDYVGECFYFDHYSYRYRFTANAKAGASGPKTTYDWDFGDGQTSTTGPTVDHVFLTEGDYTVKLSMKSGQQSDSKSNHLRATRLWERIDNPPADLPSSSGKIIADYNVNNIPPRQLVFAVLLNARAQQPEPLEKSAIALAKLRDGFDQAPAMTALAEASQELVGKGHADAALRIWDGVPKISPFQPFAVKHQVDVLLWRTANFDQAVKDLEPFIKSNPNDPGLKRLYGQALVLSQRTAEGKKVLESIPPESPLDRQAALTGALARTIEFYIGDGDWESGEQSWEKWQQEYPADFLEGYSVLLRTRLMEAAKSPAAAAKVAEAFALAIPKSSYAPRLLDRASKLLAQSDPAKSQALHAMLKQKYPEDPLAQ